MDRRTKFAGAFRIGLVLVMMTACSTARSGPEVSEPSPTQSVTTDPTPTSEASIETTVPVTPPGSDPDASVDPLTGSGPCADSTEPFTAEGTVLDDTTNAAGPSESDSSTIANLTWESDGRCDRIRITFVTDEGAPAVTPPTAAGVFLRDSGVIRLDLGPTVVGTAEATHAIGTALTDRIYVVRRIDGGIRIDVHLDSAAFVRIDQSSGPAAIVLDVQAGGEPFEGDPLTDAETVIVGPIDVVAHYPVTVDGYVRAGTDDDRIQGQLAGTDGSEVSSTSPLPDDDLAWRAFSMVFPTGPIGTVIATVGPENSQVAFTAE